MPDWDLGPAADYAEGRICRIFSCGYMRHPRSKTPEQTGSFVVQTVAGRSYWARYFPPAAGLVLPDDDAVDAAGEAMSR
jgi:hypothetical protein